MAEQEKWVVHEIHEGDGTAGAGFILPNGLTVFVTEWTDRGVPRRMTEAAFQQATAIRDTLKNGWTEVPTDGIIAEAQS